MSTNLPAECSNTPLVLFLHVDLAYMDWIAIFHIVILQQFCSTGLGASYSLVQNAHSCLSELTSTGSCRHRRWYTAEFIHLSTDLYSGFHPEKEFGFKLQSAVTVACSYSVQCGVAAIHFWGEAGVLRVKLPPTG